MNQSGSIIDVGAQDPELQSSPVAEESDEEFDVIRQEVESEPNCYFNSISYQDGTYVRSGTNLLICDKGLWVSLGSSDPDNP